VKLGPGTQERISRYYATFLFQPNPVLPPMSASGVLSPLYVLVSLRLSLMANCLCERVGRFVSGDSLGASFNNVRKVGLAPCYIAHGPLAGTAPHDTFISDTRTGSQNAARLRKKDKIA
jgi:hypothetical protein